MRKILLIALLVMSVAACSGNKKKEEEATKAVQEPSPPVLDQSKPPVEEKSAVPSMSAELKEDAPAAAEPVSTRDATPAGALEDKNVLDPMGGGIGQEKKLGSKSDLALPAPAAPPAVSPPPSAPRGAKKRAVGFHQMDEEEPTQE